MKKPIGTNRRGRLGATKLTTKLDENVYDQKPPPALVVPSSSESTHEPLVKKDDYAFRELDEARKRFPNAKSLSSEQFQGKNMSPAVRQEQYRRIHRRLEQLREWNRLLHLHRTRLRTNLQDQKSSENRSS
ncbi:hypothetical protein LINGRAHAP2_LOCUS12520 [Linum grandiflorum]